MPPTSILFCLSLIFDICPNGESVNRGWAYQASIWDSTMGRRHSQAPTFGIRGVLSASLSSLDLSTISAIENRPFEGFLFQCAERKRGWDNLGRWGQSWQLKAGSGSSWIYTGHLYTGGFIQVTTSNRPSTSTSFQLFGLL